MSGEQIMLSTGANTASKQVVMYKEPASQVCLACKNGLGVMYHPDGEVFSDSPAICFANCSENDLGKCPKFEFRTDGEFVNPGEEDNGDHNGA